VRAAERGGARVPAEWEALRQRLEDLSGIGTTNNPMLQRLITALIDGTDDLGAAYAAAMAEQNDMQKAKVIGPLRAAARHKMRELAGGKTATKNYGLVAGRFNDAAKQFTQAASLADPEADPAAMLEQPDAVRRAWLSADSFANQLTRLIPPLSAAAELAGVSIDPENGTELTLCVDPTDMHRREVWEAWMVKTGRTGRWGALTKIGAQIRAATPENITPYRTPRDIEYRQVPVPGQHGIYQTRAFDPETDEQPPEPEKALIPGRMLTR
jgi:hypothetical protein